MGTVKVLALHTSSVEALDPCIACDRNMPQHFMGTVHLWYTNGIAHPMINGCTRSKLLPGHKHSMGSTLQVPFLVVMNV